MKYRYQYEEQNDWSFRREMKHNFYRFLFSLAVMAICFILVFVFLFVFFPEVFV